jgi:cobalt-zinc-cadmium resistance protein CzcA
MIRRLVDFALQNRFLVLVVAVLLFVWGAISFHNLPVEAYPDVANNYVDVIAQWPGISAEQIEQQVTIPLETAMNGIPGIAHVRSWSIFGLSTVEMVFGEDTTDFENRERVLERLSQVTMPPGVVPQMGTDWSPVGTDLFLHTAQHQSADRCDGLEVDRRLGGGEEPEVRPRRGRDTTRSAVPRGNTRCASTPNKLISYGLSLAQVEQQLTNNNTNAGGSFVEAGLQQINVREVGLVKNVHDIENTVLTHQERYPAARERYRGGGAGAEDPAGAVRAHISPRRRQADR